MADEHDVGARVNQPPRRHTPSGPPNLTPPGQQAPADWGEFFKAVAAGAGVMAGWLYALGACSIFAEWAARRLTSFPANYAKAALLAGGLEVTVGLAASLCAGALPISGRESAASRWALGGP